jgi:deazaflavin-dependent oxidoreductase (nitroreductase family)
MKRTGYLKPPWLMRAVGNRLAPVMNRSMVVRLSVPGRTSGQWRTNPIVVLDHDGQRYLVAPFGHTDWALNLRASGRGRLIRRGRVEEFVAVEIPPGERPPLIDAYRRRYGRMPKVAASFDELPDPADHPTFRMVSTPPTGERPAA